MFTALTGACPALPPGLGQLSTDHTCSASCPMACGDTTAATRQAEPSAGESLSLTLMLRTPYCTPATCQGPRGPGHREGPLLPGQEPFGGDPRSVPRRAAPSGPEGPVSVRPGGTETDHSSRALPTSFPSLPSVALRSAAPPHCGSRPRQEGTGAAGPFVAGHGHPQLHRVA